MLVVVLNVGCVGYDKCGEYAHGGICCGDGGSSGQGPRVTEGV